MSAITEAVVEHVSYKLDHEERLVRDELVRRGIPVRIFASSHIERKRLQVTPNCLMVGKIPFIAASLRQLAVPMPVDNCYPTAIEPWLRRRMRRTTLGVVVDEWRTKGVRHFIKPAERTKRFTGGVLSDSLVYRVATVSRSLPVWCAEFVTWQTEWRAYVINGEVRHLAHYDGDPEIRPNESDMDQAVAALTSSGAPAGYAVDFGVLANGATAVVECNDGYSLGAYAGVPADVYTDLLIARWAELTKKKDIRG